MVIPIEERKNDTAVSESEAMRRAWNDLLRNANTGMMSWAEKNFKQKLIDILFHMGYYRYNQTIYLNSPKEKK